MTFCSMWPFSVSENGYTIYLLVKARVTSGASGVRARGGDCGVAVRGGVCGVRDCINKGKDYEEPLS